MKQKLAVILIFGALVFSSALPALAIQTSSSSTSSGTSKTALDTQCVQNAIQKRDNAILGALDIYYNGLKNSLSLRESDLSKAWNLTSKERKTAIKTAWNNYQTTLKSNRKNWRNGINSVWQTFYSDRKVCGKSAAAEDTTTQGVDSSL